MLEVIVARLQDDVCLTVARALVAKARCPGLIPSGATLFLSSPMHFKGLLNGSSIDGVLFRHIALRSLGIAPSIGTGCDYTWNCFHFKLYIYLSFA